MAAQSNAAPVIIKRKKIVAGGGHHGGAWKVAYADFVTAMMAFFLLMWLLNATTEQQRKGLADYFNPSVPIVRVSGGGDGMFGGETIFEDKVAMQNGTGGVPPVDQLERDGDGPIGQKDGAGPEEAAEKAEEDALFAKVEDLLIGGGGESLVTENALKHIVTRVTDEGLVIELFDVEDGALFSEHDDAPRPILVDLVRMIADVAELVTNKLAIGGHMRAEPVVVAEPRVWRRSLARADTVRRLLETHGTAAERISRVTGHADRKAVTDIPMDIRNNRIEIVILRSNRGE
ncbi:chemotaxis protein MotB [Salinihabitans flavidus]|uniref:Chemotaxis protein MotB n=1 Tax=Salinihabitans flavidus TaxID=569882 RepID=A0A1H8LS51_9RHOB|nr:flagellar motor protein MotB [Salinihabitans flavidus]SEO07931.1 chemotaxis protein MotB [Salinihabitans flavidus]